MIGSSHASDGSIDFSSAATSAPPAHELRERKVCENGCGRSFWRVAAAAKHGTAICEACRAEVRARYFASRQALKALTANKHKRGQ